MSDRRLWWKIPLIAIIGISGLVLLLIAVAGLLCVPSVRLTVLDKAIVIVNEHTDWDIDLGHLYLSPFHQSPNAFYRAFKGEADLPLQVEIDSVFIGHRGKDTLVHVQTLRLNATLLKQQITKPFSLRSIPHINVERLLLSNTGFHSGTLIRNVGVDVEVGRLDVSSPEIIIADGQYPLHGLRLSDVFVGIHLKDEKTPASDNAQETSPNDTLHEMPKQKSDNPLLTFDVQDGILQNIHFLLTPLGIDIRTGYLATNTLVDVGNNLYDAHNLNIGNASFAMGDLYLPFDTVYGEACADIGRNIVTSRGLSACSKAFGAKADMKIAAFDIGDMHLTLDGNAEFLGNKAYLNGYYDIDEEKYQLSAEIKNVDFSPLLSNAPHIVLAGNIYAQGQGINPHSDAMTSTVSLTLNDAVYNNIDLSGVQLNAQLANKTVSGTMHLPFAMQQDTTLSISAQTEHRFSISDFITPYQMSVDYHSQMRAVSANVSGFPLYADSLSLSLTTKNNTSLSLSMQGLRADIESSSQLLTLIDSVLPFVHTITDSAFIHRLVWLEDLTALDTIHRLLPALKTNISVGKGSLFQPFIDSVGVDISRVALSLASDSSQTSLAVSASMSDESSLLRMPAADVTLDVRMRNTLTTASVDVKSVFTDGLATLHDMQTDAEAWLSIVRTGQQVNATGCVSLENLSFGDMYLGSRDVDIVLSSSDTYPNALRADVKMNDLPMSLVDSIIHLPDIDIKGSVRVQASADGLPSNIDLSAEVLPLAVSAEYKPFKVALSLGEKPIVMEHNHLDLNSLPIYGADSTFIALSGGLDLDSMRLNVVVEADSFVPAKLVKDGPIPVYGDLATDIRATVAGPIDSIVVDADVTILPTTDITYPIDKKNLAKVKPHGTVNVRYGIADATLNLGGKIVVDDGLVRYSPKLYPIIPFTVDSGSNISFHGPLGQTMLDVSASQKVKADVESEGEETRRVDFITGVRVNGIVDSLGLHTIDFFLEAPDDETITQELESISEDDREGLAVTLLATGMYVGESNVAAQRGGYALSSILGSRINAAMANSKMGKFVDIDISSGQTRHASGKTNDMNIAISKSFFKDKLRITVGSTISDSPEVNKANGLLTNLTADYKLTKDGSVQLRLYSQRDYNNVLEGELYKSGISVLATKEWRRQEAFRADTITRTYGLTADAGVAYRSNNSIGPNLTIKSSIRNLFGRGETVTINGNGAYYWSLRNRHSGDPKKNATYKLGVNTALVFPYLHWKGDNTPNGDTRYLIGYQYENIAGGYGLHKISGSLTYFIRSPFNKYIVHSFTPLSLTVVRMKAESANLFDKAAEYPQLIKILAGDEFSPALGYTFTYNDYRAKRAVNTMLELGVKESGNLLNAIYCALGYKWNKENKHLGAVTFNQYVKFTAELRNRFNLTDKVSIATRLYAGVNVPVGNSAYSPLSEAFYTGGPNSLRASSPYAYGPGNFYSGKYNQNFFHAGDVKLEANFELRFPIVWKLFGAAFVDAGNVWNWYSLTDQLKAGGFEDYISSLELPEDLQDGIINNHNLARQIALGTGAGLRLDLDGLVIRLDIGVGIHKPYQTYKYDKSGKPDKTRPINKYFNMPSALDALRINFGIGYPF